MQPINRELSSSMNNINSLLNQEIHSHSQFQLPFDPTSSSNDDFLDHLLSSVPLSASSFVWAEDQPPSGLQGHFDEQSAADISSKLRQHQISNGGVETALMQQQLLLSRGFGLANDGSSFNSMGNDASAKAIFNGSMAQTSNQHQQFNHPQGETSRSPTINQPAASGSSGGAAGQPRQRVRARRGQATDPHSIAERLRRERIAERMKGLQELVPNANKTDKASMLDEIIDHVKFLQLQVKVLSMSRLGGAAAIAPLVADLSSQERSGNAIDARSSSNNSDGMTVTEHQVAKLMEEDMASAMQYLQGKGLCLMPISLATAISTSTCHNKNTLNGVTEGPSSPSMSVLTVQSATISGNRGEPFFKDNFV